MKYLMYQIFDKNAFRQYNWDVNFYLLCLDEKKEKETTASSENR